MCNWGNKWESGSRKITNFRDVDFSDMGINFLMVLNKNALSGSHALTENDYLILVYYRNIGAQYDALVGIGRANSFELQN